MYSFKFGDEVEVIFSNHVEGEILVGYRGIVSAVYDNGDVDVDFDNDEEWADYTWVCSPNELVLVK